VAPVFSAAAHRAPGGLVFVEIDAIRGRGELSFHVCVIAPLLFTASEQLLIGARCAATENTGATANCQLTPDH